MTLFLSAISYIGTKPPPLSYLLVVHASYHYADSQSLPQYTHSAICQHPRSPAAYKYRTFDTFPKPFKMYATKLFLTAVLALTAAAMPLNSTIISRDDVDRFDLHVWNNCPWTKEFALYQITADFQMVQRSDPVNIAPKGEHVFHPSFQIQGMRLSGHAERGTAAQWGPQALFEFGHSVYNGVEGTAYDLSVMSGSDWNIGIGVYPHNDQCESKTCFPWDCPPAQGWTNPDQTSIGSPADTVCYHGKTNFKVVFCP